MTTKTILVTDDNSDYRASVMDMLELEGYDVIAAENGAIALEQLRTQLPDLILCDIDMPIMTGLEVLHQAKHDPVLKTIPFVIVSGSLDVNTVERIKTLGADAFIRKPMPTDELLALIANLLNP